jgi:hypothetical protein
MADLWHRLSGLFADIITMAVISALVTPAAILVIPGAQRSIPYLLGMFVFGIVAGITAHQAPFLPDWTEWVAVLLGAVCGPPTVAKLQGKTIAEAIAEIRSMRSEGDSDG